MSFGLPYYLAILAGFLACCTLLWAAGRILPDWRVEADPDV